MREIVEEFGMGFLYIAAASLMVGLVFAMTRDGGVVRDAVAAYLSGISG